MKSKQRLRKLVCYVLCVLLLMSSFAFVQAAPVNSDIKGHWAEKQISDWISKGYVSSYSDGTFKPNTGITRAELAGIVNKAFGFTEKDVENFKDVNVKDSFYNDMAIAKKAGYLKGDTDGNANPTSFMTRQEFAVIMQRLMKLENPSIIKAINSFKDVSNIPLWSKGAIESIVASGYMLGTPDKTFKPSGTVTRAETITTLDRIFLHFIRVTYDKAGIFNTEIVNGSVAINVPDVTLKDTVINGDLIIGKGVGEGNVTLKNVTIKGNTIVKGGGMNSIVVENCTLGRIVIAKEGNMVRVVAVGSTTTGSVDMQSGGKLEESGTIGNGFGYVTIAESVDDGAPILLVGNFETIEVQANDINLDLTNGSVGSLDIAATAANTNLNIGTGSTISNLTLAAPTTLAGTGTVTTATVEGSNVTLGVTGKTTITQLDVASTATNSSVNLGSGSTITNIKVDSATSVTGTGSIGTAQVNVAGTTITAPTTNIETATGVTVATAPTPPVTPPVTPPSTGGSGDDSGSHNTNINVNTVTVTGTDNASDITADNGTLQMLAAVTPTNATNKTVTWSVTNGTGEANISNTGLLKAVSNGTVTVRATANDGSGKYGTKSITISNQMPTVLFSSTRIVNGASDPDIEVNLINDAFTSNSISTQASNWIYNSENTGLTIDTITRISDTKITFHMQGTAQNGVLTLQAKAAAIAGNESNLITIFILPDALEAAGTIAQADVINGKLIDGIVEDQPSISNQTITFNGAIAYYLKNESNGLLVSGNWVGVKITAPEGVTPDENAVLYVNGRNIVSGWNNIKEVGDGDNYFHLYQRITDLTRDYNVVIKWNNSLTEAYTIDIAETATLEGAHGGIELAQGINGGENATTIIKSRQIEFRGEIKYLTADESNGLPISGNWVGVKITAPAGVYPDENAVLTAHGIIYNRDGLPGWDNIKEEGDGDNFFYLYQRVRNLGYLYEIEIKWNNDVTETYSIWVRGSQYASLEYSETELNKLKDTIDGTKAYFDGIVDSRLLGSDEYTQLETAIETAEGLRDSGTTSMVEIYKAEMDLSSAYNALKYCDELNRLTDLIANAKGYFDNIGDPNLLSGDAYTQLETAIETAEGVRDSGSATMDDIYAAQQTLLEAYDAGIDAYKTEVVATSNIEADKEYSLVDPLVITLAINGTGEFNSKLADYITFGGALAGMQIQSVTLGENSSTASLELIGTAGSDPSDANITIAAGGVNGHSHGFEAVVGTAVSVAGTIERAETLNGGVNATTVVDGNTITFNGEIAYVEADAINGLPISGNWVGVKITAPEGVYPDENAVLTVHGIIYNRDGLPGWDNIKEEGDGDNYFYYYQRVRQTAYVYVVEIKWNNDVTETYEVVIPGLTTLEYSETELNKLKDTIAGTKAYFDGIGDSRLLGSDAYTQLETAIETAEVLRDSGTTSMVEIYKAEMDLSSAYNALKYCDELTALKDAITAEIGEDHENPVYVLTEADYTAESWAAYVDMIAMAIGVEADQTATQADFEDKVVKLGEAKANLVFAGQEALNSAKSEAAAKDPNAYTPESWATFEVALADALALEETTNALVVAKTGAIAAAIAALVPVE